MTEASTCLTCATRGSPQQQPPSDFSIDHILRHAGPRPAPAADPPLPSQWLHFEWLQCTRYRPPKLQSESYMMCLMYFLEYGTLLGQNFKFWLHGAQQNTNMVQESFKLTNRLRLSSIKKNSDLETSLSFLTLPSLSL